MQELSEGTSTFPGVYVAASRPTFAVHSVKKCKHDTGLYVKMTTLVQLLSGQKKESSVWDNVAYNAANDKSKCGALDKNGVACGFEMSGKKTRNLKTHTKSWHGNVFKV